MDGYYYVLCTAFAPANHTLKNTKSDGVLSHKSSPKMSNFIK